jgi:PAS domain S-box-containing protein/diguanylate cyclase (GGDEF)-like protein
MRSEQFENGDESTGETPLARSSQMRAKASAEEYAHLIVGSLGEVLAWSRTLPALIGREAVAIPRTRRAWFELMLVEDRERIRRAVAGATRSGRRAEFDYHLRHGRGEWIHLHEIMEPLAGEPGKRPGVEWISTLHELSAAATTTAGLEWSEDPHRAALEQAAVGIVYTSLKGKLRQVNEAFCLMSGYSRADALQLHIRDITHSDDIDPSVNRRHRLVARTGAPYQREIRILCQDGSYLWVNVTTSLVRGRDGGPRHFVSVLSDISERKRAEEEVRRFRAAMDVTPDAIFLTDPKTLRYVYVNDTACRRLGYSRDQLLQLPAFEVLGQTREQLVREHAEVIAAAEGGTCHESRYVRSDGSEGWTELYRRAVTTGDELVIVTFARDITERKSQQGKIERLSRVHAMLSGINSAIVRIRDREELLRESCRIAHEAGGFIAAWTGLTDEEKMVAEAVTWHGCERGVQRLRQAQLSNQDQSDAHQSLLLEMIRTRKAVITNDAPSAPGAQLKEVMAELGINSVAFLPLMLTDRVIGVMALYSPIKGHFDEAEVELLSQLAGDISFALEHLEKSERAAYLALYDELTGLANRRLLIERLGQVVHADGRSQGGFTLALLDIERLRSVNKGLGRHAGDALLRKVAERLVQAAGPIGAARIASNQFAVILPGIRDRSEAEKVIATISRACFGEPYTVEGTELKVGAKAGLAMFPHDGTDAETLLLNAEAALRRAKLTGERYFFYAPDLGERSGKFLPLESQLAGALARNEFVLHYQPKVDTLTRKIVGMEALIRWQSREFGLVSPAKFIPIMEETGMILEVGAWAMRRAALDHRRWVEQGFGSLRVAVNVSAIQLRHRDFLQAVEEAIREGVAPAGIDLEITESLAMDDVQSNIKKLNTIRALGVQVAIDDFGTGYSSLGYLAKLPIQALKIDQSFISAMVNDPVSMTLVQTIITLAHTLGLKVIAEGVEEEQHAKCLGLMGCDLMQGYLISKPLPFDEITAFLAAGQVRATESARSLAE